METGKALRCSRVAADSEERSGGACAGAAVLPGVTDGGQVARTEKQWQTDIALMMAVTTEYQID
jgi:hypothetical protein